MTVAQADGRRRREPVATSKRLIKFDQQIPDWAVSNLKTMREQARNAQWPNARVRRVHAYAVAMEDEGWTLAGIARALGVSRQLAHDWKRRHARAVAAGYVPPSLPPVPPGPTREIVRTRPIVLPDDVIERLCGLQRLGRIVNGATPHDAQERRASRLLDVDLLALHEQGWTVYYLAQCMGVTPHAVQIRLANERKRTR